MAGAKGRQRRVNSPHATYNVLLPVETISAIKERAATNGVTSAQIVRDILAIGLGENPGEIDIAIKVVRSAYPLPRYADSSTLGDQIADKIKEACGMNG